MRALLTVILFAPLLLNAQLNLNSSAGIALLNTRPPAANTSSIHPTNLTGYPALAWYPVDLAQTNTGGQVTNLPDQWVNAFNLTNPVASKGGTITNNVLNGHAIVSFDGVDDYLRSLIYTSSQPHDVWMVCKWRGDSSSAINKMFFDSADATLTFRNRFYFANNSDRLEMAGNSAINFTDGIGATNRWIVFECLFNGTSSAGRTNNVSWPDSTSAGTVTMSGFTLGANAVLGNPGTIDVAEIATYGGGNAVPGTNTLTRSNLFFYFTNKFGSL